MSGSSNSRAAVVCLLFVSVVQLLEASAQGLPKAQSAQKKKRAPAAPMPPARPTAPLPSTEPAPSRFAAIEKALAEKAIHATVRVACAKADSMGMGFVHKSGRVVTAEHVVRGCAPAAIVLITVRNQQFKVAGATTDTQFDLALLTPATSMGAGLAFRNGSLNIGDPISLWGFPAGYPGTRALLTMGYISGETTEAPGISRLWINGAINSDNSGGPLVLAETGEVVGVVVSKLAPIPDYITSALEAMAQTTSGVVYTRTKPDGSKENLVVLAVA